MRRRRAWWRKWSGIRRITGAAFLLALVLGALGWFPFIGSTSATTLVGIVPFVDPLAAFEVFVAGGAFTQTTLIGAGILLGAAVVLGPIFCGYVCPLGFVLDLNQTVRRVFRKRVLHRSRPRRVPGWIPHWFRYVLLGGLVGFVFVSHTPVFQTVSPINLLVRSMTFGLTGGLVIVAAIVVVEWFVPRVWCRSLCPLGALYSTVGQFALFRVRVDPSVLSRPLCKQCTVRCPMGIPVMESYAHAGAESVSHPGCIRCGDCVDICPGSVLRLGFPKATPAEPERSPGSLPVLNEGVCASCGDEVGDQSDVGRGTVVSPGATG